MKYKIKTFYKEKFILFGLILYALIFLFVLGSFYKNNFTPKVYDSGAFKSSYTEEKLKKINESGETGVFTYGPYINLKQGEYIFKINYSSDYDNYYDITTDYGANILCKGVLPKGENDVSVNVSIDKSVYDNSIEIRTYYKGKGEFIFDGIEIYRESVFASDIANLIGTAVFLIMILFLLKYKFTDNFCFLLITAIYALFYGFMQEDMLRFGVGYIFIFTLTGFIVKSKDKIRLSLKEITESEIVFSAVSSYIMSSLIYLFKTEESADIIEFIKNIDFFGILFFSSLFFILFLIFRIVCKKPYINYRIQFLFIIIYSVKIILETANNVYFSVGVILIMLYIVYFLLKDDKMKIMEIKMKDKHALLLLCLLFLGAFYFIAENTIYRYKVYASSTYDFGIFMQMFENMARSGAPVTTCERGELLSHFFIHFSPIYYLILPFYMIFRSPEGLLSIQAFSIASAAFPVYFISRKFKNSPFLSLILSAGVLALPGFVAPAYFDFHENKFLAPMILWFIFFMERYIENKSAKSLIPVIIFEALSLIIKEDASLYIIVLALYYMAARKEIKTGALILLSSAIYFTVVMAFIQSNGYGLMEGHYGLYYLNGQSGVIQMFVNIFKNPTFLIKNIFTEKTFIFMLYIFVPLMFVPAMCKNYKNLILLIPLVFINLMTDYGYQNDIGYQYTYGVSAILIFLFILNIKDKTLNFKYACCITAVFASVFMLYAYKGDSLVQYKMYYKAGMGVYEKRDEALLKYIPEDASVAAYTFIVPHLYKNYELYTFDDTFDFEKQVDYIVTYSSDSDYISRIDENEYSVLYKDELIIYERRK